MDTAPTARATGDTSKVGMATLIAGLLIIAGGIGSEFADPLWLLLVAGFALLIYAIPRIHRYQAPADGAAGEWGARLVVFGGSLFVLLGVIYAIWELVGTPPEDDDAGVINFLWPIGFFSFLVGIISFSIASIRAKVLPSAGPILMLVGLIGGVGLDIATGAFFEDDESTMAWGALLGIPLFGLGLALIGYWLRSGGQEATGEVTTTTV